MTCKYKVDAEAVKDDIMLQVSLTLYIVSLLVFVSHNTIYPFHKAHSAFRKCELD